MINIVLVEPQIPQNTGNIARTCAATGSRLHLVKPLGFNITDASLKRAGLDYWNDVDIFYYDSLDDFMEIHKNDNLYFSTFRKPYSLTLDIDSSFCTFNKKKVGILYKTVPSFPVITKFLSSSIGQISTF